METQREAAAALAAAQSTRHAIELRVFFAPPSRAVEP